MPVDASRISFRPVVHADLPKLRGWMEQPHWREWWGETEIELGYVRDMLEGRDSTQPFIFRIDGRDCGYIQMWIVRDARVEPWITEAPWVMDCPDDCVGVDLSVGDGADLSKGYGTAALKAFVAMLRDQGHRTIIIDPDPENARAVACYRKAGFAPIPELEGRTEGVLLMRHVACD